MIGLLEQLWDKLEDGDEMKDDMLSFAVLADLCEEQDRYLHLVPALRWMHQHSKRPFHGLFSSLWMWYTEKGYEYWNNTGNPDRESDLPSEVFDCLRHGVLDDNNTPIPASRDYRSFIDAVEDLAESLAALVQGGVYNEALEKVCED